MTDKELLAYCQQVHDTLSAERMRRFSGDKNDGSELYGSLLNAAWGCAGVINELETE